ncbi:MAG: SDR family oxidoreductase [Caldilineaceae bacterium]
MASNGKTALITGGSRGIGRGIARKLAQSGTKIAINYVTNEEAAKQTLAQVRELGGDGFIIQADVTQPDDIRHLFSSVQAEFGKLDIFVSNARPEAAAFFYPPLEITLEQWDSALDSQAKAFLLGAREAAKLMADGGGFWRSPTLPVVAPAAYNRGWRWVRPRRRWSRWCAIMPWRWPNGASPSMPSALAGLRTVS